MTKETKEQVMTTEERFEKASELIDQVLHNVEEGKVTKSAAFRELYEAGLTVGQISKVTGAHYSFVYGVISSHYGTVKSANKGPSKSDTIRKLAADGLTPGEIAKRLNSNYSFVHSVVKKWRMQQEQQEQPEQESTEQSK